MIRATDPPASNAHRQRQRASREAVAALIIALIALAVASTLALGVLGTNGKVESGREGRRVAITVLCGGLAAVIEAGRDTITGGGMLPPELEEFLERHGYPPDSVRAEQAEDAAVGYATKIANAIAAVSHRKDLVDEDTGRVDCERLTVAARAD